MVLLVLLSMLWRPLLSALFFSAVVLDLVLLLSSLSFIKDRAFFYLSRISLCYLSFRRTSCLLRKSCKASSYFKYLAVLPSLSVSFFLWQALSNIKSSLSCIRRGVTIYLNGIGDSKNSWIPSSRGSGFSSGLNSI